MQVSSLKMSKVFSGGGEVHYVLPAFQREYAWEKENWETLLNDAMSIYDAYDPHNEPEHFLGALVVISDGNRGTMSAFKLVDGQQRLTTISVFLAALSRLVKESHPTLYRKIRKHLENSDESGDLRYKLVPTAKLGDRQSFFQIIDELDPLSMDSRIPSAFRYAYQQLEVKILKNQLDPEKLFLVFANCMHVVFITLDQSERPFEIFESLNAKGKALTQPDLVRNYIAMKLSAKEQEDLFTKYWAEIENLLRESRTVSRIGELTAFLRHYLAFRKGMLFRTDHIYARFRDRMEQEFPSQEEFAEELRTIHRFAGYYDRFLRPEKEQDQEIQVALQRLNVFEAATAYPFLLALFEHYHTGQLKRDALLAGLSSIENYLARRYLSAQSSGYTNKMFPTLEREINYANFESSLHKALAKKNYPSDRRMREALPSLELYDRRNPNRITLVLETINQRLSKGTGGYTVLDGKATVEHVMPQSLSNDWLAELGSGWEQTFREYLNTIGNLTLVTQEWNSSLSNERFSAKKARLANHALRINHDYFSKPISRWDEAAILERAAALSDAVVTIWPGFSEVEATADVTGRKPASLLLDGSEIAVKSWRDVVTEITEFASEAADGFETVVNASPEWFSRDSSKRTSNQWRQLRNGWYVYVNVSGNAAIRYCERIASVIGLTRDDWEIRLRDSDVQ